VWFFVLNQKKLVTLLNKELKGVYEQVWPFQIGYNHSFSSKAREKINYNTQFYLKKFQSNN
jgi:hypothetical protein